MQLIQLNLLRIQTFCWWGLGGCGGWWCGTKTMKAHGKMWKNVMKLEILKIN